LTDETGVFIALDGVDGSGNSTHTSLLARWIQQSLGRQTLLTKEPTTSPTGRLIRRYLRMPSTASATDALLFAVDRIEHVEKVIKPALSKGMIVVTDRYLESSVAYQSAQGLPIDWILTINRYALKPSLNIILDIEPEKSLQRKSELTEKFEEASFLGKVRKILLDRAKSEKYPVVNTCRAINESQAEIERIVGDFLRGHD
jgi:dTMP kinase